MISASDSKPDIVFITETWLNSAYGNNIFPSNDLYNILRSDRSIRGHGGCAVMIHNQIMTTVVNISSFAGYIEYLHFKVSIKGKKIDFILVYRSPDTPIEVDQLIIDYLDCLGLHNDLIITGDFNLPSLFSDNPDRVALMYDTCFSALGLSHGVSDPTRGANVLDLLLSTDIMLPTNVNVVEPFSTSDHSKVTFSLNIFGGMRKIPNFPSRYDYSRADWEGMKNFICSIDFESLFKNKDVNEMCETFCHFLQYAQYLYVPKKRIKSKCFLQYSKMTRDNFKRKLKLWKKYKKTRSILNKHLYNLAAKEAKKSCFADVVKREEKILECGDLKRFYNFVNSKMTSKNEMPPILANGAFHDDPKDKANFLQDQFVSVFTADNASF